MARQTLDDILGEADEFGLLDVKPIASGATSEQSRIEQGFEEINQFYDRHGHLPGDTLRDVRVQPAEKVLQLKLQAFLAKPEICEALAPFDRHRILALDNRPKILSLDEILDSDDDLLSSSADDIFTFERAPVPKAKPDWKSERKQCEQFENFKPLLDTCVADINSGKRETRRFKNEQEIKAGEFFILNGVMVYVAEVNDPHVRNGKKNARLRLIFDNGTEGENLLRSLATELYKDKNGRRVTDPRSGPLFADGFQEEPRLSGVIYIVKSLSPNPEISKLDGHLFKIGFTSGSMETRIATAKDDATFLLAPVHPVKTFTVYGVNTVKMENLIHRFFIEARLDIEIKDRFGKPFKPREWFLVPLEMVEQAIAMLIDGTIVGHRYDGKAGKIVKHD